MPMATTSPGYAQGFQRLKFQWRIQPPSGLAAGFLGFFLPLEL